MMRAHKRGYDLLSRFDESSLVSCSGQQMQRVVEIWLGDDSLLNSKVGLASKVQLYCDYPQ
jgi:hypothetical protein